MAQKFKFYERYGVEEYYVYDPDEVELIGWLRSGKELEVIEEMNGWVSPRLGVRFQVTSDNLEIFSPSGERFLTFVELAAHSYSGRYAPDAPYRFKIYCENGGLTRNSCSCSKSGAQIFLSQL